MGGVAVDNSGILYSAMAGGYPPVLRVSGGIVSCLEWGPSGPQFAQDVALDNSGNLYFISQDSSGHYLVYKVSSLGAGTPTVVAGTGTTSFGCSVGTHPYGLALDNRTGNLYIADAGCNVTVRSYPATSCPQATQSKTLDSLEKGRFFLSQIFPNRLPTNSKIYDRPLSTPTLCPRGRFVAMVDKKGSNARLATWR
jgi:DNA-binding beta-propeller fold protein YncE